jgi:WD40-like Beta Propeller Repeat
VPKLSGAQHGGARRLVKGPVHGAVWSSRGLVALVRAGWIWVGRPGHGRLRRLARGRSPSFSPDGVRLALARDGYVWVVRVADGSERRLVRGGAPAWSPDGRRIAYIGAGGAVEIIAVHGGRPRRVGSVRGTALDWQPIPSSAKPACTPPRESTVVASNREAVVFLDHYSTVFFGCLKALGRTRLLLDTSKGPTDFYNHLVAVRLAGRFAALEPNYDDQYGDVTDGARLYDLGSGKATHLADVWWIQPLGEPPGPIAYGLDFLALDSSGFTAWRETPDPMPQPLNAVSCPSAALCVAGDQAGNILSSTNPAGGPTAWSSAAVSSNQQIGGVSCPSISLCVAADENGNILTSTAPTGGASAWTKTTLHPGPYLRAVSCPSVSLCVGGGGAASIHGGATILTSTDPTGGKSSWSSAPIASGDEIVEAVSCPSISLCVATTSVGDVFTSTNPTGGASAWTKTTVDQGAELRAVSCPSVSLCVAGGTNYASGSAGNILTSTNPTGGASAWTQTTVDQDADVDAVSCPSVSLCVAGDDPGNVLTSTDPTGGASAWTKAPVAPPGPNDNSIGGVSCPSVSLCVAADQNGNILTSTAPTGGANAWTSATVDVPGCPLPVYPCMSEQLYAHDDQGTRVLDTAPYSHGNPIGNVALDGDSLILTWTHDGAQRQLELH